MKKILLNESEKKAIIADREKAILESFVKTFNKIKRIDENELGGEENLRAKLHTLVGNEMKLEKRASMSGAPHHEEEHRQAKQALVDFLRQNPSMNEFLETVENHFLDKLYEESNENGVSQKPEEIKTGEAVANELQKILSPEEIQFLTSAYTKGGKEVVAKAIDDITGEINEDTNTEPPAEGEFGMSAGEIKLRQIIDKFIMRGTLGSLAGIIPAAMMANPGLALGLGIAAIAGFLFKDAAWWKRGDEEYPHHHNAQSKYGAK
jgi:hypothetical protein